MDSILISIKKLLGIDEEYEHFDTDILIHINTVFMNLTQIGVGPAKGFTILGETEVWSDFVGDTIKMEAVKTFVYLKVRLIFDPPANSFLIEAINNQLGEIEWRLQLQAEGGENNG